MSAHSSRLSSRTTALVTVAGAHVLVLWALWRIQSPPPEEVLVFTSTLFFAQRPAPEEGPQRRAPPPSTVSPRHARRVEAAIATPATPPAVRGSGVDWSAQLSVAADSALKKEAQQRDQLGVLTRPKTAPTDPRNPGQIPNRDFRWYEQGIHRIDTRSILPSLWVSDHCVLIAFVMPACMIGHIEIHGDLFKNRADSREQHEATPRPNDVP